jgi:hypothetical protein
MTTAIRRTRASNGPRYGTAAVAVAIASACMVLLVVLLTPTSSEPTTGAAANGTPSGLHWDAPAHGGVKLIPI